MRDKVLDTLQAVGMLTVLEVFWITTNRESGISASTYIIGCVAAPFLTAGVMALAWGGGRLRRAHAVRQWFRDGRIPPEVPPQEWIQALARERQTVWAFWPYLVLTLGWAALWLFDEPVGSGDRWSHAAIFAVWAVLTAVTGWRWRRWRRQGPTLGAQKLRDEREAREREARERDAGEHDLAVDPTEAPGATSWRP
jgi:hypothetical protein